MLNIQHVLVILISSNDMSFYVVHIIGQEITGQSTARMHVEKPIEYIQKKYLCTKQKYPRCKNSEAKSEAPFSLFIHSTKKYDIYLVEAKAQAVCK